MTVFSARVVEMVMDAIAFVLQGGKDARIT